MFLTPQWIAPAIDLSYTGASCVKCALYFLHTLRARVGHAAGWSHLMQKLQARQDILNLSSPGECAREQVFAAGLNNSSVNVIKNCNPGRWDFLREVVWQFNFMLKGRTMHMHTGPLRNRELMASANDDELDHALFLQH